MHFGEFDALGCPRFAGWVFNGFDTPDGDAGLRQRLLPTRR